jgi:hypothetical protein
VKGFLRAIAGSARTSRAAKGGQAVFMFLAMAGLLGAAAAGVGAAWLRETDFTLYLAGVGGSVVAGAVWLAMFTTLADLSGQHGRDLEAQALFASLQRGEAPKRPFALYLRPFSSTNVFLEEVLARQSFGASVFVATSTQFELEQQIEQATRRVGPLVALGEPLEHIGAGRIRIGEDQWRDAVKVLSDHAALIILLPSSRPGTLWEVERLLESGLIARTVVVDPPNAPGGRSHYDPGSEWAQVRAAFAQRGYAMPKDSRVGQLLYFGRERAPKARARLDMDAEDNIAGFFRRVLRLRAEAA